MLFAWFAIHLGGEYSTGCILRGARTILFEVFVCHGTHYTSLLFVYQMIYRLGHNLQALEVYFGQAPYLSDGRSTALFRVEEASRVRLVIGHLMR